MKTTLIALILALVLATMPATAYASCTGFIDCLFGWSERAEVRAQRDIEKSRIEAQRAADVARIQAEQAERVRQADGEVERVKLQRYETEAQRDIAIAQAQQQAEQYKAMIAGLTAERLAGIQSNADSQIATLQVQAQIATAGILETGKTERWRIAGGWAFSIVAIALGGLLVGLYMRWQPQRVMLVCRQQRELLQNNDETGPVKILDYVDDEWDDLSQFWGGNDANHIATR